MRRATLPREKNLSQNPKPKIHKLSLFVGKPTDLRSGLIGSSLSFACVNLTPASPAIYSLFSLSPLTERASEPGPHENGGWSGDLNDIVGRKSRPPECSYDSGS